MSTVNLTEKELDLIKVLADFLFKDEYDDKASFPTFEKIFGIFFEKKENISLETVYKELCGKKRKFLTLKRLIIAYLKYKNKTEKLSEHTTKFWEIMFAAVLGNEEKIDLGEKDSKRKVYTSAPNKNRTLISKISILTGKFDDIRGLKIEYDDLVKSKLYDKTENLIQDSAELKLDVIEDVTNESGENLLSKITCDTEYLVRDSISHIFGSYSENKIELLGFKTRSGQFYYKGQLKGKSFLYGVSGKQFHTIKIKVDQEYGITFLKPFFIDTYRKNENIDKLKIGDITEEYLKSDLLIYEEGVMNMLTNSKLLEKYAVSASVVQESTPQKLRAGRKNDDLSLLKKKEQKTFQTEGKDKNKMIEATSSLSLNDILTGVAEEKTTIKLRASTKKIDNKPKPIKLVNQIIKEPPDVFYLEDVALGNLEDVESLQIDELTVRINRIEQLRKTSQSDQVSKQLDEIYNNCVMRRNKLIELQEEKVKEEMIKNEKINKDKYQQEEEKKRKDAVFSKESYLSKIFGEKMARKGIKHLERRKNNKNKKRREEGISNEERIHILKSAPDEHFIYR